VTLTRRGLAVVTVAIAALTTISAGTDDLPNTGSPAGCRTIDLPEDTAGTGATDELAARLVAAGWRARADDHAERLYAPGCPR
jgi:hypothetical protein